MPLQDCQVQIRDLVMGPGTPYTVLRGFNPFERDVRANATGDRAWNHGSWSGAEWQGEVTVPIPIHVTDQADRTPGGWLAAHRKLVAAFRPVGDSTAPVELRFEMGGAEYVMYGRPRMVTPNADTIRRGWTVTEAAFVALDPFIYAAQPTSVSTGLPQFTGGLSIPVSVPFSITATLSAGFLDLTNNGTAPTPMVWRLDGPAPEPRAVLQRADGTYEQLRMPFDVPAGHYLEVDTGNRTVLLDGVTNRRGFVIGDFPLLPPEGPHRLRWFANEYDPAAKFTVTYQERNW